MEKIDEKIQIKRIFSPESVFEISNDEFSKMSEAELKEYLATLISKVDTDIEIDEIASSNNKIISNGEEWD